MAAVRLFLLLFFLVSLVDPSACLSDAESLIKFKQSLNITKGDLNSWRAGTVPCKDKWWGVICSAQPSITGIHITRLGLSGTADVQALASLKDLRTLRLDNNSLSGPLPLFNQLVNLRSLLLSNNSFSGDIFSDYFTPMVNLRRLFLDNNKFTGTIPDSVMKLNFLEELHLDGNSFTGPIPPAGEGTKLKNVDFSRNNLEGEIPESFASFDPKIFEGNANLCGKPLSNECEDPLAGESGSPSSGMSNIIIVICIFLLLLFLLLIAMIAARRRRSPDFRVLDKEHLSDSEVVEVHVPESTHKVAGSTKRRDKEGSESGSKKGAIPGKGALGDLIMVDEEKGIFGLPDLMKASAEVLGNGSLGSAYKAVMSNGLSVVVKRIREMNKVGRDAFDVEMRRFGKLRHPNVLSPLAYHYRREEKLLVSEYMPKSSLLYVLHGDRGMYHSELTWPTRLNIIKGVARGMDFIHTEFGAYDLPHGNLKSSNVLLKDNYETALSDYAFLPLINPNNAPQALFGFKTPEYVNSQQVTPKSDVYCMGIVVLEIITGKFPSQYVSNGKGGTDIIEWVRSAASEQKEEDLIDPEIKGNKNSLPHMVEVVRIGIACIESNPDERLDMKEAVRRIEQVKT